MIMRPLLPARNGFIQRAAGECTGCGNFFTHEDCADEYKKDKDMLYFPPVGHNLKNIPAKDATCVDKGTVEYWHCERCGLNFSDNEGENELTNIETDAPLLLICASTAAVTVIYGRRKKQRKDSESSQQLILTSALMDTSGRMIYFS